MAAWVVIAAAALLFATFGSKISAAVSRILLYSAAKCGLLSNVRVSDTARISIRVSAIKISFWKCLWAFLHAPTQTHMLLIEVPAVHIHVMQLATAPNKPLSTLDATAPAKQQAPRDGLTHLAATLDLTSSFKNLQHTVWSSARVWIHRLSVACYFVHLVQLRVDAIAVDIVETDNEQQQQIASITHGSVRIQAAYNSIVHELVVAIALSHCDRPSQCAIPSVSGSVTLGFTEIRVATPVSCSVDDDRAPVPTSCVVTCDALAACVDFARCMQLSRNNAARHNETDASERIAMDEDAAASPRDVRAASLLLVRLIEALPNDIGFVLRKLELRLCGDRSCSSDNNNASATPDDVVCTVHNVSLRVSDPASQLLRPSASANNESLTADRKALLEFTALRLGLDATVSDVPPVGALDVLKVELDAKFMASTEIESTAVEAESDDSDDSNSEDDATATLSCTARVNGEVRGLSAAAHAALEPWITRIHATLEHQQRVVPQPLPSDELLASTQPHPLRVATALELEIQFKLLQTEVFVQSLDNPCAVLCAGVPSVLITIEEINVFAHPFVDDDQALGVRSKADIQCSRLKILTCARDRTASVCFISLDFTRVFIAPTSLLHASQSRPADVEMEAEWLEVKWSAQALHAIGGMLELGIVVASAFLKEDPTAPVAWRHDAKHDVQPLQTLEDVTADILAPTESIAFRCTVKRALVLFAYSIDAQRHVDYVTVESLTMGVEASTGRFRIAVYQTKVYNVASGDERAVATPTFANQRPPRRSSFVVASKRTTRSRARAAAAAGSRKQRRADHGGASDGAKTAAAAAARPYFTVQCFALEENKLRQCPKTVVDIFVDAVHGEWDIATQLRVMELVRQITFAVWEMLYAIRRGYAVACTSSESRYNRIGGINPPMDDAAEFARHIDLLDRIVSASGDTLNRMHATNVNINARFANDTHVALHIGVFGGSDMPDLWTFRDIALKLNALQLVAVDAVDVRHTVAKRRDYVFGEFEAMLLCRAAACDSHTSDTAQRRDGMLVDVAGVRVRLAMQVPLLEHVTAMYASVVPFEAAIAAAAAAPWRPQHDLFFQYFLRAPMPVGKPQLWLTIDELGFECLDVPLESWLERTYPLWLEELQEQELRAQMLDDHVWTLKLAANTDTRVHDGDAYDDLKALLAEKNALIYVQKARKLQATFATGHDAIAAASGVLLSVQIGRIAADVSFECDARTTLRCMRALDEATDATANVFARHKRDYASYAPVLALLEDVALSVAVDNVAVRIRNFATPLLVCSGLEVSGRVITTASSGVASASTSSSTDTVDSTTTGALAAGLRVFMDLDVQVAGPLAFFSPSYLYTLDELAGVAQTLLPLVVFDVDKTLATPPWDIARRLVHGKLHVVVQDAAVRLLNSTTSFVASDYLEVALGRLELDYAFDKTIVRLQRLTAKIDPGSLSNIVEFANVTVEIRIQWTTRDGDSAVHFGYPLEHYVVGSDSRTNDCVVLDAYARRLLTLAQWRASQLDTSKCNHCGRHPLIDYAATGLSVFVRGTVCPWTADATGENVSTIKRTKHEVATRTAIVLYTKHIEWLIRFASVYSRHLPQYPFPRRRRRHHQQQQQQQRYVDPPATLLQAPPSNLLHIVQALVVEDFTVVGLDVAVYHSEKNPIGIRAFVNDQITVSGAVLAATHALFQPLLVATRPIKQQHPRRLRVAPLHGLVWVVHDANVAVEDIQVRVCTPTSGSRGESLVSVKHMTLKGGGGTEITPTHDDSTKRSTLVPSPSSSLVAVPGAARTESVTNSRSADTAAVAPSLPPPAKKNILDHFSIAQHNPYCFRDSDDALDGTDSSNAAAADAEKSGALYHEASFIEEFQRLGFLLGLSTREARILITISAVEALVDIVENWMRIVTVCLPALLGASDDDLKIERNVKARVPDTHDGLETTSPKKVTSLTEDPKFGAIFYESVVRDESNNFVTRLAPPSFLANSSDVAAAALPTEEATSNAAGETTTTATASNVVESFFMVKFMDCQVSIQDHRHKGSVLLALNCGAVKDSISSDACHELIDVKIDGLQLFTAPLDVDVKSRIVWLKTLADGSYCPSSFGLLQQVIAPIPTKVIVWVDRNQNNTGTSSVCHKVDLQIPTIQIRLNIASKDILQNVVTALTDAITAKINSSSSSSSSSAKKDVEVSSSSYKLQSAMRSGANATIQSVRARKQALKWKIADLQWRQACRWNYYINERTSVAFAAAENSRSLAFELETSPLFRPAPRKVSATASVASSIGTTMGLSSNALALHSNNSSSGSGNDMMLIDQHVDELQRLTQQLTTVSEMLHALVAAERKKLTPRALPSVELAFLLESASLTLCGTHVDIVCVTMQTLRVTMKHMRDDASGTFALVLQQLSTQNLCPNTPYPDLLQVSTTSTTWGGGNAFLRIDAEVAAGARPTTTSGDSRVGSALKRAAKVAGKAAAHPLGIGRSCKEESGTSTSTSTSARAQRSRSFSTSHDAAAARAMTAAAAAASANETQLLLRTSAYDNDGDFDSSTLDVTQHRVDASDTDAVAAVVASPTASSLIHFKHIRIGTVDVVVTYKNKKRNQHQQQQQQALEDMRGVEVKVHALVYCDKTCSLLDLVLRIRRDVILDVLSQVGRNFTNIATFLKAQVDGTRWGQFDALAPLKTLSTTVTSLATSTPTSVRPAPVSGSPAADTTNARARAATAPTEGAPPAAPARSNVPLDTYGAHKFQLELPESHHRSLWKKHTLANVRAAEVVGSGSSKSASPLPVSPRFDTTAGVDAADDADSHAGSQSPKSPRQQRSTAEKAKHAITHLFSKKRTNSASLPLSPTSAHESMPSPSSAARSASGTLSE